nr:hypothetical protein [Lysobacter sp.]
ARLLLQQPGPLNPRDKELLDQQCAQEALMSDPQTKAAVDQWNQDQRVAVARHARKLAASSEPHDLLAAALIASLAGAPQPSAPGQWSREEAGAAFTAATQRGRGDALINWMEAIDCPRFAAYSECDAQAALLRLQRSEPDNAAVWLLAYTRADQGSLEAEQFLDNAARATRYQVPFNDLGALMQEQYAAVDSPDMSPLVAKALAGTFGQGADQVPDVAGINAMAIATVVAMPALSPLQLACFPPGGVEPIFVIVSACTEIYTLMSEDPPLISQRLALVNLVRITVNSPEGPGWRERLRQLHWIQSHAIQILGSSAPQGYMGSVWRDGEVVAMQGLLAAAGISSQPPGGWLPDDPRIRAYIEGRDPRRN